MNSGLLNKIPPSPAGKTGWPWTKGSKPPPPLMPDGKPWPKISIVTPSYNQGQFLEETIRSVLLQNYPNLEYIIMDGGSDDDSVEIIKKYEPWLTYWVSKKDEGQADAIYQGFEMASGQIITWLNSDDFFLPGAFMVAARAFMRNPTGEMLIGDGLVIDSKGKQLRKYYAFPQNFKSLLCGGQFFMQMASFWKRKAFFEVRGFDTTLKFCFDYDLFLRLIRKSPPLLVNKMISTFRLHESSKTSTIWEKSALKEIELLRLRHGIDKISEGERLQISRETMNNFYRVTRRGIMLDAVRDPAFFAVSFLSKIKRTVACVKSGHAESSRKENMP